MNVLWVLIAALRALGLTPDDHWASVLDHLDRARAAAFAHADPARLDRVYAPGSAARTVDTGTISSYAQRGGRVAGARLRVLSCRVLVQNDRVARLDVVDRLDPAEVVWADGTSDRLPRDRPTRRIITLVHTVDGWRIAGTAAP